ncbi:MAG: Spy/CpxP family protein refolding chaperone [Actinomycetota bacterium]
MNSNLAHSLRKWLLISQRWSLLAGTLFLVLFAANILAAFAQPHTLPPPEGHPNLLNLTQEQQEKMQKIRQSEQAQFDNILTPEQKARLQTARDNREAPCQAFASLNLTEEQKTKIQELRRATMQQIDSILTPEQRQQMQQHPPAPPPPGGF